MKFLETLFSYVEAMAIFSLTWLAFNTIYTAEANIFETIILAFLGMCCFILGLEVIINVAIQDYDERIKKNESNKENKDEEK